MKDFPIYFYEDHGLWTAKGLGIEVRGFTSAMAALDAWKNRIVECV